MDTTTKRLDVKEIALHSLESAKATVLDGGEVTRMLYAQTRDGKLICIAAPGEGEEHEPRLIQMLRAIFIADDVCAYAMVSEVWTSTSPAHSRARGSMPMHDPNRGEALLVLAVADEVLEGGTVRRRIGKGSARITREPTAIGELEWMEDGVGGTKLTGRYTMLMPPPGTIIAAHERAALKAAMRLAAGMGSKP